MEGPPVRTRAAARPLPEGIPVAFSIAQVARALSVSASTVYAEVKAGALPAIVLGQGARKKRVIALADLEAYLAARRRTA